MMRPLEPDELMLRCDLAGIAKVLTVRPDSAGSGALARLEFSHILKGRVESLCGELPGIAIVKSGDRWLSSDDLRARQPATLNVPVVRLIKRRSDPPIIGTTSRLSYEAGTLVFTYVNWSKEKHLYVPTWWNALAILDRPPRNRP